MKKATFAYKNSTEEEMKLEAAIGDYRAADKDEKTVLGTGVIAYIIGFPLFIFSNDIIYRVGFSLVIVGLFCLILHRVLQMRTLKKRIKMVELLNDYNRERAVPFFLEITEKFGDVKNIHFHLEQNGSITVTDKRKKEDK